MHCDERTRFHIWFTALLLSALAGACSSNGESLLGAGGVAVLAPTVITVSPADDSVGVSVNAAIMAGFSQPIGLAGLTVSVTCAAPCTIPVGTVALDSTGTVATFSIPASLAPVTAYSITFSGARSLDTGVVMASSYQWNFTTGSLADIIAPTVSATTPTGPAVPINSLLSASFSEPMNPLTLTDSTFTLACPLGAPVTGVMSYAASGNVAIFTPTAMLPPSTTCRAQIGTGAQDVAGNALAGAYAWSFTTTATADSTAPTVTATTPTGSGVATNALLTASFSEPMNPLSLTNGTFTLACPAGTPVSGTVGYAVSGSVATFTPSALLPASITCAATLTTGVEDASGNSLGSAVGWSFTTSAAPDTASPTVSSTSPVTGAGAVPINTLITASFSEGMDPLTVTSATFTLACPGTTPVAGIVGYAVNGNLATFTPAAPLPASSSCTVRLTTGVTDAAGNPLAAPFNWGFDTGAVADITAPTVGVTTPSGAGVALNTVVTVSFSEPMNALTLTSSTFTLACPGGTPVPGAVGYAVSGSIATFTPSAALPASTTCIARIGTGAQDAAGNAVAAAFSWNFTTGVAPDLTAPTVSSTSPAAGTTGVAINSLITASFNEPMDPLTLTSATFTLSCPGGSPVTGTVGYAVSGNVATFTPTAVLPASTICTAQIGTGAQDAAGNGLATAFSWSFTTGVAPDVTAPTVSSTSPAASATGVAINTLVTASFSEPMDPLTLTSAIFTLGCPAGAPVTGTVGYAVSGNVATFTPTAVLPASTICTAQIGTGAQDAAGNAIAAAFSWSFTTGVAPDVTPPTVTSTNPLTGAVGVCTNKTINATFSEAMDPLTISTATLALTVTAGAAVTGVVTFDAMTNIATFDPGVDLIGSPATNYTATIRGGSSGVKDLAGNPLAADVVTTFTTNSSTCTTAPPLGVAAPFGGFGGLATLTNDGLATVINGDIGVNAASTTITGLHDAGGNVYTITPDNNGSVNGLIYTATAPPGSPAGVAVTQARTAALASFNSISPANLPGGIDVSSLAQCPSCGGAGGGADELAGRTLPPGIYLSAAGTFDIGGAGRTTANLTLDAGGDTNAVWVFQTTAGTGTLNVGLTGPATPAVPIMVLLVNGAQPRNVFWFVPAGATIGTGSTVAATLLANAAITISTTGGSPPTAVVTTINGRAISLTAAVTMTNAVINVPPP
ncbi:MAG: Ig-like domain-containing protein [Pseudomonadota bacterium]